MGAYWSRSEVEGKDEDIPSEDSGGTAEDDKMDDFYERRKMERQEEMEEFRRELAAKRRYRQEALGALGRSLREERDRREKAEKELEELKKKRHGGGESGGERGEISGEGCEGDGGKVEEDLKKDPRTEELEKQVKALKDVASISRQMLAIRERQVDELSAKLKLLEETGTEYEMEVKKVRRLKELYEEREKARDAEHRVELERERARLTVAETRLSLARQETRDTTIANLQLTEKTEHLTEKVTTLDNGWEEAKSNISDLKIQLATKGEQLWEARSQLDLVNGLFTRVLSGRQRDIDRLARLLEENRPLIMDLTAKGRIDQVASVLMDLATPKEEEEEETPSTDEATKNLAENLNKVWRVLVELLSHHKSSGGDGVPESCYKSVETPVGPRLVISPSQTFIRLKDLILEKNCLVKEVGRLKMLNGHLESRLGEQENRLQLVTTELHNTWGVVNKLRNQHKQLHTQEKILRYELSHKRHLLTELKKELEICREQWEAARVKNSQTEEDWKILREEFASRKRHGGGSTESSGFEDEETAESEEEERLSPVPLDDDKIGTTETVAEETLESTSSESDQSLEEIINPVISKEEQKTPDVQTVKETNSEALERTSELNESEENATGISDEKLDTKPDLQRLDQKTTEESKSLQRLNFERQKQLLVKEAMTLANTPTMPEERRHEEQGATSDSVADEASDSHETKTTSTEERLGEVQPQPSTSETNEAQPKKQRTVEEMLAARDTRLKRLEEQCKSLVTKMSHTSVRSEVIANKLEELHQQYGEASSSSSSSSSSDATIQASTTETKPEQQ